MGGGCSILNPGRKQIHGMKQEKEVEGDDNKYK
jgi:hypothetical protein